MGAKNPIFRKTAMSSGKIYNWGKFSKSRFSFQIRFGPFWMNSIKKISTKKCFLFIFSTYDLFFRKKWPCPLKSLNGRFSFEIEIFILEYIVNHSESIPIKKISSKNFCLRHFYDQKWPKSEVFRWFLVGRKFFFSKNFCTSFQYFLF